MAQRIITMKLSRDKVVEESSGGLFVLGRVIFGQKLFNGSINACICWRMHKETRDCNAGVVTPICQNSVFHAYKLVVRDKLQKKK